MTYVHIMWEIVKIWELIQFSYDPFFQYQRRIDKCFDKVQNMISKLVFIRDREVDSNTLT